jgi:glycosyltransferase A (GT-A) superfamily protein (DUF2064 family)
MRDTLIVVLCKPPGAEDCKTRLAAGVGRRAASALYERCLGNVLRTATTADGAVRLSVAGRPLELAPLARSAAPEADLVRQLRDSFAERQRHEIDRGLADGYRTVILVASDLVGLSVDILRWARAVTVAGEVAVVPSPDGGYSVLGTSAPLPELAQTPMSSDRTLSALVDAVVAAGRRVRVADFFVADVDELADLERYAPDALAAVARPGDGGRRRSQGRSTTSTQ